MKRKIVELHSQYQPKKLIIENKGSGISLIQQLRREHNIYPIAYEPKLSKKERIMVQSGLMESGQVLLPKNAGFLDLLKSEVVSFPYGKHDDQVDALAQMLDKGALPVESVFTFVPRQNRMNGRYYGLPNGGFRNNPFF